MPNYVIRESLSWRGEREWCREDGTTEFATGRITRTETYLDDPGSEPGDVVYTFEEDLTD